MDYLRIQGKLHPHGLFGEPAPCTLNSAQQSLLPVLQIGGCRVLTECGPMFAPAGMLAARC
jgi:hypothetical protein